MLVNSEVELPDGAAAEALPYCARFLSLAVDRFIETRPDHHDEASRPYSVDRRPQTSIDGVEPGRPRR
jgi:hypothetical protein